jgi:membrane protease YdiL (CAAX protease family)
MVDRRSVAALIPGIWVGALDALRGASAGDPSLDALAERLALSRRVSHTRVPWTGLDAARAALLTLMFTVCGAVLLFVARLLLSVGFLFGEGFGAIRPGTFDHLSRLLAPYSAAITTLALGTLLFGSLLFAALRLSVRKYRQPWAVLGFRGVGWRVFGAVAALFLPVMLVGLIVTRLETTLLGGPLSNPQIALLTRGMPALPLNFLLLFVLLAVIMPIAEEAFFRGFLYRLLRNRLPVWAAASLSAAAFAAFHGVPVLFPWLFCLGLVYAMLAERTGSLYPGMLLHGMINALATLSIVVILAGW